MTHCDSNTLTSFIVLEINNTSIKNPLHPGRVSILTHHISFQTRKTWQYSWGEGIVSEFSNIRD